MNAKRILGGLATVMMSIAGTAGANDGTISDSTLADMGLSGATVVSDAEAMEVRGNGFAVAAGGSFAFVGSHKAAAGSANGYFAVGKHFAGGINGSIAGKTIVDIHVHGGGTPGPGPVARNNPPGPRPGASYSVHIKSINVYAGGFSAAASF